MTTKTLMFTAQPDTAEFALLAMCTGGPDCSADPYHRNSCKPHLTSWGGKPKSAHCVCGFPAVTEAGDCSWDSDDPAWARQHAVFHLTVFPGVRDHARTLANLRDDIVHKTARQRGCDRKDVFAPPVKGTTMRARTVTCVAHGEVFRDDVDTAVHSFDDPAREPWRVHVLDGRPL